MPTGTPGNQFFGRQRELERLSAQTESGAVTVLGPPGVGKSRLIQRWLASGGQTARWCNLRGTASWPRLLEHIAAALNLRPSAPGAVPEAGIRRALTRRPGEVLVLDGLDGACEERGAALAALALALAPEPGGGVLIITCRADPGAGQRLRLAPLVPRDAAALFLDRATHAAPRMAAPDALIRQLVVRLDGLPLALELAAARCAVLGPLDLLSRLDRRFELLRPIGGEGQAMEEILAECWAPMSETERRALTRLSVWPGRLALAAAEAALTPPGPAEDPLSLLQRLVDTALLQPAPEGGQAGFYVLESVRGFALAQADPALHQQALERRDAWVLARGEALVAAHQTRDGAAAALRELMSLRSPLMSAWQQASDRPGPDALRAALCLDPLSSLQGSVADAIRRLELGLERLTDADRDLRFAGGLALLRRLIEARMVTAAASLAGRLPPAVGDAEVLALELERSRLASTNGLRAASEAIARAALARAEAAGEALWAGKLLGHLGFLQLDRSRTEVGDAREAALEESARLMVASERLLAPLAHPLHRFSFRIQLGLLKHARNDPDTMSYFRETLAQARESGRQRHELRCLFYLGAIAEEIGKPELALSPLREAVALSRLLGEELQEARCLASLGGALLSLGQLTEAERDLTAAVVLASAQSLPHTEANATLHLGYLAIEREQQAVARTHLERAIALAEGRAPVIDRCARWMLSAQGLGELPKPDTTEARADDEDRLFEDFCEALSGLGAGDPAARPLGERVLAELTRPDPPPRDASFRVFTRLLAVALSRGARLQPQAHEPLWTLRVSPSCERFRMDDAPSVDLAHRPSLQGVLAALVARRQTPEAEALTVEELLAAGWPGQRVQPEAGANRVYAAVRQLRRLGLGKALITRGRGYRLSERALITQA